MELLVVLVEDATQILTGLLYFLLQLFAIPLLFTKVSETIMIVLLSIFVSNELHHYIYPPVERLKQLIRDFLSESGYSRIERARYLHFLEETGDGRFRLLLAIASNPRIWWFLLKCDFDRTLTYREIIKYNYKSIFFALSLIITTTAFLNPVVFNAIGLSLIVKSLISFGIKYEFAVYASLVFSGSTIYALRPCVVGLMIAGKLALKKICCCVARNDHPHPPPPPRTNQASPTPSHHHNDITPPLLTQESSRTIISSLSHPSNIEPIEPLDKEVPNFDELEDDILSISENSEHRDEQDHSRASKSESPSSLGQQAFFHVAENDSSSLLQQPPETLTHIPFSSPKELP